jgi:hypothetical protein
MKDNMSLERDGRNSVNRQVDKQLILRKLIGILRIIILILYKAWIDSIIKLSRLLIIVAFL